MAKDLKLAMVLEGKDKGAARLLKDTEAHLKKFGPALRGMARESAAYGTLGIRSQRQIIHEIRQTQAAYNRLARSGRLSGNELSRAAQAAKARIRELNAELGKAGSGWQRVASGGRNLIVRGGMLAAGSLAAGNMLAQPVGLTMDYDTALRHAANTMYAGKSLEEKRAGMRQIDRAVSDAAYIGGTGRENALAAMNTMVASGTMSDAAVLRQLPAIMKTAAAADADASDIANIVTKALAGGLKEADIGALLDRAMQSGADGGFEMRDMARWLPAQLAAMKSAGMPLTLDNISTLLNTNQKAFVNAGSADEAGNNVVNYLAKLASPDTVSKAKKIKIDGKALDWTDEMNKRLNRGMNSIDASVDIVEMIVTKDKKSADLLKKLKEAEGDEAKTALLESQKALVDGTVIGQLFSDRQALMAFAAVYGNKEADKRLREGQANAAGAVDGNYALIAEGAGFKTEQAKAAKSEVESRAFGGLAEKVGGWFAEAAKWARGNPEHAAGAMQTGYGGGAAATVYGSWKAGSFLTGGGAGGGAAAGGGLSGAAAPLALAAAPLALMGGAAHLAGRRENYGDYLKPIQKLNGWLDKLIPDMTASSRAEYLKKREELGGNNAPAQDDKLVPAITQQTTAYQTSIAQQTADYQASLQANGEMLGGKIGEVTAALASVNPTINNNIAVNLDGRVIANEVSRHQVNMFGRGAGQ